MGKRYPNFQDPTISNWLYNAVGIKTKRVIVQNVDFMLQAGNVFKIIVEQKSSRTRLEAEGQLWVSRAQRIFMVQLAKQLKCKAEYVINKPNADDYCYTVDMLKPYFRAAGSKWLIINLKQCKKETKQAWLARMRKILSAGKGKQIYAWRIGAI